MTYKEQVAVIIPSLEPDDKLVKLVGDLRAEGFVNIIIVNDGSPASYDSFFETLRNDYDCTVLQHAINLGKGRGLKTAFNHVLINFPNCIGAVTADSDGQHSPKDIAACAAKLQENPDALVMGCRQFVLKDVPLHNRLGNIITRKVTEIFAGIKVADTQTGLRGIPRSFMQNLLHIKGERFEFEMNMLLKSKENHIAIIEVPIETIYDAAGQSTHFKVLTDSVGIYAMFAKFFMSSIFSFLVDIVVFTLLVTLLKGHISAGRYIFLATLGARILSSLTNFFINHTGVFRGSCRKRDALIKYYTLCVIQLCVSAGLVYIFHNLTGLHETPVKIVVDVVLFFISFQIQREWVFKRKKSQNMKTSDCSHD